MSATKLGTLMSYFIQKDVDMAVRAFFRSDETWLRRSGGVTLADICLPPGKSQSALN